VACRLLSALVLLLAAASASALTRTEELARDMLAELVAIDTFRDADTGRTRKAADRLAAMLKRAGFAEEDVRVLGLTEGDGNLVARYRSPKPRQKPVLLMAHLDTVSTSPVNWDTNPLQLIEKDGYYYGRGTRDLKGAAAMLVANFIRLRSEGFRPKRDVILLLTADEETTGANLAWLLDQHRPLLDAAFALNTDAGYVDLTTDGRPLSFVVQTAEKVYASFALEASSAGGHSSRPTGDNAIYKLAGGLRRLQAYRFPRQLSETTRVNFGRWAPIAPPEFQAGARALGAGRLDDPTIARIEQSNYLNAMLHTTCVATQLSGGGSENALPERARAVVNCRVLPESSPAAVEAVLRDLVQADGVTVAPAAPVLAGPASPLDPQVLRPVEALAAEFWPGIPVLPEMSPGATDGLFTRNAGIPTYGVGAVPEGPDDDTSHGPNERIRIAAFNESMEFWYRLTRLVAR
jgi:acetylornithine deacetylase/succinyl-diaminopimelate desuccinylase-like protein